MMHIKLNIKYFFLEHGISNQETYLFGAQTAEKWILFSHQSLIIL